MKSIQVYNSIENPVFEEGSKIMRDKKETEITVKKIFTFGKYARITLSDGVIITFIGCPINIIKSQHGR